MVWFKRTSSLSISECVNCGTEITGKDITFHNRKEICPNCKTELRKWNFSGTVTIIDVKGAPNIIKMIIGYFDNIDNYDAGVELFNLRNLLCGFRSDNPEFNSEVWHLKKEDTFSELNCMSCANKLKAGKQICQSCTCEYCKTENIVLNLKSSVYLVNTHKAPELVRMVLNYLIELKNEVKLTIELESLMSLICLEEQYLNSK